MAGDPRAHRRRRARRGATRQSHQVRCEYHVGVVEQGVVLRRFGLENIKAHAGELPGLKPCEDGVEVNQAAATAVDQDRSWPYAIQKCFVDQVMVSFGEGYVQRQDVACRGELQHVGRCNLRRRRAEWVVRHQVHSERCGEVPDPPPDPSVADDADHGTVQVTHGNQAAIRPPAVPDEIGRRP
mgnify:CR=1 FL=1